MARMVKKARRKPPSVNDKMLKNAALTELQQGRRHARSVDEYLTEGGWTAYGSLMWTRGAVGPLGTREAFEMQLRDDEDAGWTITGLTLERMETK